MNEYLDIISSAAVALAVNLLLLGILAATGIAVVFRLTENISPRLRYFVAVAAFVIVAFAPVVFTCTSGNSTSAAFSETKQPDKPDSQFQKKVIQADYSRLWTETLSSAASNSTNALDNFVVYVADNQLSKAFFILWFSVAVLLLLRELLGHIAINRARKKLRPANDQRRKDLFCPEQIRLYFSDSESPATVGLFRPVVILPVHFPNGISLQAARCILQHEIAHARWRDPLVNACLRIVRAAFWISPGLWFLERQIRIEREAAADCAALSATEVNGALSAEEYAASLLEVARFSDQFFKQRRLNKAAAANFFGDSSELERRIQRIFTEYGKSFSAVRSSLAVIVVVGCISVLSFLPVASRQTFAENKRNDNFQMNDSIFIGRRSPADIGLSNQAGQSEWVSETNQSAATTDKSKNTQLNKAPESVGSISAKPTPPVTPVENSDQSNQKNLRYKLSEDVILPIPAQEAVKPTAAAAPVKPILPATVPKFTKFAQPSGVSKPTPVVEPIPVQTPSP